VRCRFPSSGPHSSRWRSRPRLSRFLAAKASAAFPFGRSAPAIPPRGPFMQTGGARRVDCGTPCALRLGGLNPMSQPLTSSVATTVLAWDLLIPRSRRAPDLRRVNAIPRRQDAETAVRFRDDTFEHPGCLPSFWCSALRSSELPAFPVTFLPTASHLFARRALLAPRQKDSSCRAALLRSCLGLPLGSPRREGDGAPNRLLQPTLGTCTHDPRSTSEPVACATRPRGSFPSSPFCLRSRPSSGSSARRRTTFRQSGPG
jgi:hypothetical protein